jgi:hypothetical protein
MPTSTFRIAAEANDGWWNSNSTFANADNWCEFGERSYDYHSFFMFTNITVPKHSIITACKVTLTAQQNNSGGTEPRVYCYFNNTATPTVPTNASEGNALTVGDPVSWSMPDFVIDTEYDTPDLATIFQALVDKETWASGNSAMFLIKKPSAINTNTSRYAYDYHGSTTKCALLTVTYSAGCDVTNYPFTLTSALSAYSVDTPESMGYAYEEGDTGSVMDIEVKTGEVVAKNITQLKQMKYLYYDLNTHGKDVVITVYIDGTAQTNTITLNTTSRTRGRYEDIPDTWQGYRFSLDMTCEDVTDEDLEIYAPFAILYNPFGE